MGTSTDELSAMAYKMSARAPPGLARSLAALHEAGIAQRLVTTMPGRVSVLVDSKLPEKAVRVLHATFIPVAPDPRLTANPAA